MVPIMNKNYKLINSLVNNPIITLLFTVTAVFLCTTLILKIAGAPAFSAYYHIFKGSLGSWSKFGHVLKAWIPLTLCSVGLLYTFRINLWNIGIEGQMIMGAVFCTALLRFELTSFPPSLVLIFSFFAGLLGGALWALLAGFLKTKGGVNEIFAGLGLNFVAQGIILWLIFGPWKRPGVASMSGTEILPYELWLPISSTLRVSTSGLFIALLAIIVTGLLLKYTKIGLGLKAIGNNPNASLLYGLKPGNYMLIAMIFAGGLAGIAGCIQVTGVYHRLIPSISSNYGYLGLLVVMLSNYDIKLTPFIAFFFACLNVGSIQLPMVLQLDSSLSGVIQGSFVLATLAIHATRIKIQNNRSL